MLKVLLVCAAFSIIFEVILAGPGHKLEASIEGVAIFVAVMVVAGVGSFVDWKKEVQFVKSRAKSDEKNVCNVLRNGKVEVLHHNFLHVGDVIMIQYGMAIPVDGYLIQSAQLLCDESAMTGESDEIKKELQAKCMRIKAEKEADMNKTTVAKISRKHDLPSPLLMSGTSVSQGEGKMLVLMCGDDSCLGQIIKKLKVRPEVTPLQNKLETIATDIGMMGTYTALLTIHVLLFRFFIEGYISRSVVIFDGENGVLEFTKQVVHYVIIGVAIIVVAVPEGLPLAVMISLAYSIERMLKDNNDVKRLASCEIMGGADNICSDKTGTLTLNQMKVTNIYAGKDIKIDVTQDQVTKKMTSLDWEKDVFGAQCSILKPLIEQNISCNSGADPGPTDKSMIDLLERCGTDITSVQKKYCPANVQKFPFTSKRKRMSCILENVEGVEGDYKKRLHIKGASEIVKNCCSHFIDENGQQKEMDDTQKSALDEVIHNYAKNALRTIAVAYKDVMVNEHGEFHDEPQDDEIKNIEKSGLTLICILGIMDIVRTEVPGAVDTITNAGVTVRMVTGDNIVTAQAIAVLCHIIPQDKVGDPLVCIEGPEFYEKMGGIVTDKEGVERVKNFAEFKTMMPHLKVMARSRPEDKYLLVTGLRQMGAVVAVTGDGTNDAPALKKADVGFAMGMTGTDVCKEAADILITDDNFSSIVKAAMWGRNVYDNIQRFLQFQLTVNIGALITTFIGSCITKETPLQAIQLLWVNLIMDSLAALALATELPKLDLLDRAPQNRADYIVSRKMIKHILYMAIYQCIVLFVILFGGEYFILEPIQRL
jgi:Ca2+ transporting ATPase